LINTQNPQKAKLEGDQVLLVDPDTRDRVWQLGDMGPLEEANHFTYNLINDSQTQHLTLQINENNLPETYEKTALYAIQFWEESTLCTLQHVTSGVYECKIKYATTSNMDLVKNARFTEYPRPITLYAATGEEKEKYCHMSEAVEAGENGDIIKVKGGSILHESTQSQITGKELTITSENDMYTLDYSNAETAAFHLTEAASLTVEHAVIKNAVSTDHNGGAFSGVSCSLTIKNTIVGTNTTINGNGGGIYLQQGKLHLSDSTITNNSAQAGGGVYILDDATINRCTFLKNLANTNGGAVYNEGTLHFYDNTLDSNTANNDGKGIFIKTNAIAYNSQGQPWRHFNAPHSSVNIIENTDSAENTYTGHGTEEGSHIKYEDQKKTNAGRLSLTPSRGTEGERQIIHIVYTLGTFFSNGNVKFVNNEHFPISDTASITIGNAPPVNASEYLPKVCTITITGITAEANTMATLTILATIPPSHSQARNKGYVFSAISDPDGSGTAWKNSDYWVSTFISEDP